MIPPLLLFGLAVGASAHDTASVRRAVVIGGTVSVLWGVAVGVTAGSVATSLAGALLGLANLLTGAAFGAAAGALWRRSA